MQKEPKPIYIGFGSVVVDDPDELTNLIIEAVVKSNQRAILVKGRSYLIIKNSWKRMGRIRKREISREYSCIGLGSS